MCQIIPKNGTCLPFCAVTLGRVPPTWSVINKPQSTRVPSGSLQSNIASPKNVGFSIKFLGKSHGFLGNLPGHVWWHQKSQWLSQSSSVDFFLATSQAPNNQWFTMIHYDSCFPYDFPPCFPHDFPIHFHAERRLGLLNAGPLPAPRQHGAVRRDLSHAHQTAERRDDTGSMA